MIAIVSRWSAFADYSFPPVPSFPALKNESASLFGASFPPASSPQHFVLDAMAALLFVRRRAGTHRVAELRSAPARASAHLERAVSPVGQEEVPFAQEVVADARKMVPDAQKMVPVGEELLPALEEVLLAAPSPRQLAPLFSSALQNS